VTQSKTVTSAVIEPSGDGKLPRITGSARLITNDGKSGVGVPEIVPGVAWIGGAAASVLSRGGEAGEQAVRVVRDTVRTPTARFLNGLSIMGDSWPPWQGQGA
jgi:hypothetical protein